jgi:FkbM family methyltransferase
VFVYREYSCVDDLSDVDLVVDCGANVGFASAYFLNRFPRCSVVAVEPEPSNFKLLEANLAPYGGRVRAINSGVWSHTVGLKISEARYRDGREWATQLRESRPDEIPDMQAVDIGSLLKQSRKERISLLKIDIEGAEAKVFSSNYEVWLPYVDNLVIELHDDAFHGKASETFFKAIATTNFKVSRSGELTVCKSSA